MYDIFFDLNDMHQVVDGDPEDLSKLYDELVAVSQDDEEQFWHIGENFDFDLGLDEEKVDDYPVVVQKTKHKAKGNGCTCPKCGEFFPHAEPNQPDDSFKCWSCRNF